MNKVYKRAWELLEERLAEKTSWGRNDLKAAMNECFRQAVDEMED